MGANPARDPAATASTGARGRPTAARGPVRQRTVASPTHFPPRNWCWQHYAPGHRQPWLSAFSAVAIAIAAAVTAVAPVTIAAARAVTLSGARILMGSAAGIPGAVHADPRQHV